jgi:hypothetical protein
MVLLNSELRKQSGIAGGNWLVSVATIKPPTILGVKIPTGLLGQ